MHTRRSQALSLVTAALIFLGIGAFAVPSAGAGQASGRTVATEAVADEYVTTSSICRYKVITTTPRYLLYTSNAAQGYFQAGTYINAGFFLDGRLETTHTYRDKHGTRFFWVNARHVSRTDDLCWG